MIIIGEKINGSIPAVAEAIAKRDAAFIKARAVAQEEAGATFIDCCASVPEAEEVETLKWMIDCIQEVTDLPIAVDSPSADVLTQAWNDHRSASTFEHTLVGEWAGVTAVVDGREIDLTNWDVPLTFESDRTGYTTAGVLVGRTTLRFTWEYTHINNLGDLCYTCYLPNNETMYVVRNPLDEEVTLIMGENASVLFTPAD